MKKHLSKIITLALILGISTVFVKADSFKKAPVAVLFEVDFDFQIGNKHYPKGTYKLSKERQSILILENLDTSRTKLLFGVVNSLRSFEKVESKLSFNRYGDTYFLRQVVSPALTAKIKLSSEEKKIREATQKKLAKVAVESKNSR